MRFQGARMDVTLHWFHGLYFSGPRSIHIIPIKIPMIDAETMNTTMFWNRLKLSDQYRAYSRMKMSHTKTPTIEATISPIGPDLLFSIDNHQIFNESYLLDRIFRYIELLATSSLKEARATSNIIN